jgi:hypothetical protein
MPDLVKELSETLEKLESGLTVRPPGVFMREMEEPVMAQYPRYDWETEEEYRQRLSRIIAGIWHRWTREQQIDWVRRHLAEAVKGDMYGELHKPGGEVFRYPK